MKATDLLMPFLGKLSLQENRLITSTWCFNNAPQCTVFNSSDLDEEDDDDEEFEEDEIEEDFDEIEEDFEEEEEAEEFENDEFGEDEHREDDGFETDDRPSSFSSVHVHCGSHPW